MKRAVFFISFFICIAVVSAQNADTDSLVKLHQSGSFHELDDTVKADICRRLAIDNVRKSSQIARQYAEEFYQLAKKTARPIDEAISLNLMGVSYVNEGNLGKGLEYYLQSLAIRKEIGDETMISNTSNNIGTVYVRLGQYEKGIGFYRQALEIRIKNQDQSGMAQTYNNLGVTHKIRGNLDSALYYLEKSLEIKRALGDRELIASSLNNLGEIAAINDDEQSATRFFNESLLLRREIGDKYGMAKTLSSISDMEASRSDFAGALQALQQAMISIIPGFTDTSLYANPAPGIHEVDYNTLIILKKKAEIYRDMFGINPENTKALSVCFGLHELIIDFIDQIRLGYLDEKNKLYIMQNNRDIYSDAVTTAIELLYQTKDSIYKALAFELAERGKARILLDLITGNEARVGLNIPDTLLSEEKQLKHQIGELRKQLIYDHNNSTLDSIERLIFANKRRLEELTAEIETRFPDYGRLKSARHKVTFADVQHQLDTNALYLQYHLTDTVLYTFVITHNRNSILQVALQPDFRKNIDLLNSKFTSGEIAHSVEADKDFSLASNRIYQHLVHPVLQYYDKQKLIIVPDGELYYIPLGVMISEMPPEDSTCSYKNLHFLIQDFPVSYNYSAAMFINSQEHKQTGFKGELLAFALSFQKEEYAYTAENINMLAQRGEYLTELPGVKSEVGKILECIPGKAFFDEDATEHRFKQMAGQPKLLHIATHGLIDNSKPMFSRLIFAGDSDGEEDGDLFTWELYNMRINAGLAVLSACNTGYGKLQLGEGMMTLARGFMYSGVPSLVISLWNVNDASTVEIMAGFYQYLSEGLEKDQALQRAKIDYLKSCDAVMASPLFWGGFVNLGNTSSIEIEDGLNYNRWIFLAGLALLAWIVFIAVKRKSNK